MRDAYSQSLQQAIRRVDLAFRHFFRRVKNGETPGFPRFKSRKRAVQSFDIPQFLVVEFARKHVRIPKIGRVKAILHREFDGEIRRAVVTMTKTGSYFISISVETGVRLPEKPVVREGNTVGIDLGIHNYATMSNGERIDNPRYLEGSLRRLGILQRKLSRKKMGSRNRKKAKLRVAKLHEKIRGQRTDFQHKLSTRLVRENQGIVVEDLNVLGMLRNRHLSRNISDAAWSSFLWMLEYKCEWNGVTFMKIGRFEPTSKMCSFCGHKNDRPTLSDRDWTCLKCGTVHDRNINAAMNIKRLGLDSITPRGPGEVPVDLSQREGMKQEVTNVCR
ncbi:MAG: RNA-guided endonuclease InsQ/TnpB family protein [Candidatus Thorarchaeota archaeon]